MERQRSSWKAGEVFKADRHDYFDQWDGSDQYARPKVHLCWIQVVRMRSWRERCSRVYDEIMEEDGFGEVKSALEALFLVSIQSTRRPFSDYCTKKCWSGTKPYVRLRGTHNFYNSNQCLMKKTEGFKSSIGRHDWLKVLITSKAGPTLER